MQPITDILILVAIFVSVLLLSFTILSGFGRSRQIARNLERASDVADRDDSRIDAAFANENPFIGHYYEVIRKNDPESLEMRLIRAGFLGRKARRVYNIIRLLVTAVSFVSTWFVFLGVAPTVAPLLLGMFSMLVAGIAFILVNAVLDRLAARRQVEFRRLFPDFMDLLIVCVDAGLSIEAAIDRVAREFMRTKPAFGFHLSIISLEVRAGRPLHEALNNFSTRVGVEEARTLSTMFRQSQELGASIVKTLRVFGQEMRELRLIRAEELANALPVKMLLPLAGFLFPVNLVIVLVPIMIQILRMFINIAPTG
ncbi:type II secretion system F family protein [Pontitalea aquivivens]|uniref:type II secretion system F family protein n=1 Tax=Pontitalea aquivivens TaxID=3388663 RepID=UPI0039705FE0